MSSSGLDSKNKRGSSEKPLLQDAASQNNNNNNMGSNPMDSEAARRNAYSYPMIKRSDMNEDMQSEVLETCVNACERHSLNNETAAKQIKESLDRKFGASWHVVVGEGFGFEVSYELKNLMYMFFAGNLAICCWKCS
eukprot:TRINITY_DN572_c0_g1_i1.p1 TRINITY_DN572_c0_g1~~TRINITY_DN572_c0_g1_i1.p1  ORF type:complete len:137 (-),score=47.85 TRINITY_DN572_c0_g1_i1:251-661(-)